MSNGHPSDRDRSGTFARSDTSGRTLLGQIPVARVPAAAAAQKKQPTMRGRSGGCLLYTSDAADEL